MALQVGIVGLPNVGKSTLFNTLSKATNATAANFPFCTIDPNIGVIMVPDPRLKKLEEMVQPERVLPTTIEIVDIAGLVKGASKGEGLGNQFLGNIKETDAILHVVRCFEDGNVIHVDGSVNPVRDKEVIDIELQLKDLETVTKTMQKYEKQAKVGSDKQAIQAMELLHLYKECLEDGRSARTIPVREDQEWVVKTLNLLTNKPILYVCNVDEASAKTGNAHVEALKNAVKDENAQVVIISAKIESEIALLESEEEQQMFLQDLGLTESGMDRLIHQAYLLLE